MFFNVSVVGFDGRLVLFQPFGFALPFEFGGERDFERVREVDLACAGFFQQVGTDAQVGGLLGRGAHGFAARMGCAQITRSNNARQAATEAAAGFMVKPATAVSPWRPCGSAWHGKQGAFSMSILSDLGRWLGPAPATDPNTLAAVERAVAAVDPRLKTVSGYARKLAPAVDYALDYCAALVAEIPGPIDINARAFGADPQVHAMFAAAGDIGAMLGKSRELRQFLADPAYGCEDEFFALLGMRQREKAVLGMALRGDVLQHQVPQRQLYFADHTLGELGSDCAATRQRLAGAAFDGLALGFAAHVAQLRQQREDARIAWSLDRAAATASHERRQALEGQQQQAIAALAPAALLCALAEWLAAPQGRLYLKPSLVRVDRMGVIAGDGAADGDFSALSFPELVARDRRQWTVLVARISRQDAQEALRRQQQANRYLII